MRYVGHPLSKPDGNNDYGIVESAEECQTLCQNTEGCNWFTMNPGYRCWLKSGKGTGEENTGWLTGPVNCAAPDPDADGNCLVNI